LLCRVVEPGRIRRGDRIEIEQKTRAPHHSGDDSVSGVY
jgi:MOSC domain-containing protein YiiM